MTGKLRGVKVDTKIHTQLPNEMRCRYTAGDHAEASTIESTWLVLARAAQWNYHLAMPRFTTANAREMAARSHAARRERGFEREALPAVAPTSPQTNPQQDDHDQFINKRLARVRKQLDRLDGMIEKETDPMKLDRLASAQARLAEQERLLAGRPMPGSFRPKKPPEQASRYWELEPLNLSEVNPEPQYPKPSP